MKRRTHPALFAALLALIGCGSDATDPVEPEPTDPIHVYAGTGQGALGPMGKAPHETQLYWPQDVTFAPDGRPYIIDHPNRRVITLDDGQVHDGRRRVVR
jgi:hypothetical protein